MDFLNPVFLSMLGAVGVPVLIHFLSRRKIPEFVFSSLMFLKRSQRRSMRTVDFRRLLLLILRIAGVAMAALAFARPVMRGGIAAKFPGGGAGSVAILLDRSYSMSAEDGDKTVFQKGVQSALEIIDGLDEEDEVEVFLFDIDVEMIFKAERFRAAPVADLLRAQSPSFFGTDIAGAYVSVRDDMLAGRTGMKELYIISDFQRSGFGNLRGLISGPEVNERARGGGAGGTASGIRTFLVPVVVEAGQNVSIDGVQIPRIAVRKGGAASISVLMKNHSPDFEAKFPLRVSVEGKRVLEREITIPPGYSRTEQVELAMERSGWIRGEASKRSDRLRADDRRMFSIHSREKDNVLLISDDPSFYLEQALSPRGESAGIELRKIRWDELVTADLDWADLAVIGPGSEKGEKSISVLRDFVSDGGGLLVLVTEGNETLAAAISLNELSIDFNAAGGDAGAIAETADKPQFLSPFDREDMSALFKVRFIGIPVIDGVDEGGIYLRFENGSPFVWRENLKKGRMIFAAIDPDPEGGDLVLSPFFLPLVRQLVYAAVPDPGRPGSVEVGETIIWEDAGDDSFTVVLPDGSVYLPEAGASGPGTGVDQAVMNGTAIESGAIPGYLTVEAGDGEVLLALGVNPRTLEESDLSCLSAREAADSLRLEDVVIITEKGDISSSIRTAREGTEFSTPFMLAAAILFVAELFIAQRRDMADGGPAKDVE